MRPARYASRPGFGGQPHGPGHAQRVFGVGDAGVQQHAVDAQFHGHVTSLAVPTPASTITG